METILKEDIKSIIINRIKGLNENCDRLWGKMTVNEMVCHCTDQIKLAMGEIKCKKIMPSFLGKIFFYLIMLGMPTPKGKVETPDELKQGVLGTSPTSFDKDVILLLSYIENFDKLYPKGKKNPHPAFGKLSKTEWGKLIYAHLDHHLKQFGV